MKKFCTVLTFLVFCAAAGWGVNYTWTGGGSTGAWNETTNWDAAGVPDFSTTGTGDTLTINRTGSRDFTAPGSFTIGSITVTAGTFTTGANTITVGSGFSVDVTGSVTATGSTVILNGGGTIDLGGSSLNAVEVAGGTWTVSSGTGTLNATSTVLAGGSLDTSGTTGTVALGNLSITAAASTLTLAGTETLTPLSVGGTVVFTGGTDLGGITGFNNLTISGGGHTVPGALTVTGDLTVDTTLTLGDDSTVGGNLTVSGTLTNGSYTLGVTGDVGGAGLIEGTGQVTVGGNWTDTRVNGTDKPPVELTGATGNITQGTGGFDVLTVSGSYTAINSLTVETLDITGLLDSNGNNLTISASPGTLSFSGTLRLRGSETISGAANFNGTVEYYNTTASTVPTGYTYKDLTFTGGNIWTVAAPLAPTGTLTIAAGTTLNMSNYSLSYATLAGGGTLAGLPAASLPNPIPTNVIYGALVLDGGTAYTTTGSDDLRFDTIDVPSGSTLSTNGVAMTQSGTVGTNDIKGNVTAASGISLTGNTGLVANLTAATGDITLAGTTTLTGGVTLTASGGSISLAAVTGGSNDLTLSSGGAVSSSGTISTSGTVSVTVTGTGAPGITLNNTSNAIGTFTADTSAGGGTIALVNSTALILGNVNAGTGNVSLTSGGAVTQTGSTAVTAGALTLGGSSATFTLNQSNNDVDTLQTDTAYPVDITFVDTDGFSLAAGFQASTSLSFTANGSITMNGTIATPSLTLGSGTTNLELNGNNITGPDADADIANGGIITFTNGTESLGTTGTALDTLGGTVIFGGGTGFAGYTTFTNLTLNGGTHVVNAGTGDITVNGTLTIGSSGALTLDGANMTGPDADADIANGGIITFTNGTESLGSTGPGQLDTLGGTVIFLDGVDLRGITGFNILELRNGIHTPSAAIVVSGTLSIGDGIGLAGSAGLTLAANSSALNLELYSPDGILDFAGFDFNVTGTVVNNGTIRLLGRETLTWLPGNMSGSGTTIFYGTANSDNRLAGLTKFYHLTIEVGAHTNTTAGAALTIGGNLLVSSGSLTLGTNTGNVTSRVTGNVTVEDATLTIPANNTLEVSGSATNGAAGTGARKIELSAGTSVMTVGGDWNIADLDANSGSTVTFNSAVSAAITTNDQNFGNIVVYAGGVTKTVTGEINTQSDLTVTAGALVSDAGISGSKTENSIGGNLLIDGGTFTVSSYSENTIGGNLTVSSGTLTFSADNDTGITGNLTVSGGTLTFSADNDTDITGYAVVSDGSLILNGTTDITGSSGGISMALSGGTVTIPDNSAVTVSGAVTMSGSTATLAGPTVSSQFGALSARSISQAVTAGNKITGKLHITTVEGIDLRGSNTATELSLDNDPGTGGIQLTNTAALILVTAAATGAGIIDIDNTGTMSVTGNVTTGTGNITLASSGSLTMGSSVTVETTGTITLESDGAMAVVSGTAINSGTIYIQPKTASTNIYINNNGTGLYVPSALLEALSTSEVYIGHPSGTGSFGIGGQGAIGAGSGLDYHLTLRSPDATNAGSMSFNFINSSDTFSLANGRNFTINTNDMPVAHSGSSTSDIALSGSGTLVITSGSVGASVSRLTGSVPNLGPVTLTMGAGFYFGNTTALAIVGDIEGSSNANAGDIDITCSSSITLNNGSAAADGSRTDILASNITLTGTGTGTAGTITLGSYANLVGVAVTIQLTDTGAMGGITQNANGIINASNTVSISASGGNVIQNNSASIGGGNTVSLTANTGNITQNGSASIGGGNTVSLTAAAGNVTQTVNTTAISGDTVTVSAGGGISLIGHDGSGSDNTVNILHLSNSTNGNITYIGEAGSGGTITLDARNTAAGGTVSVTAVTGNIAVAHDITYGAGPVISSSSGAISITAGTGNIGTDSYSGSSIGSGGGDITLLASEGTVTVDSAESDAIVSGGGNISLNNGIDADSITLHRNVVSGTAAGGNIDFYKPVIIGNTVSVTTGTGAGNISFHDTVEQISSALSTGEYSLTLTAGTGNIVLNGIKEENSKRIGDFEVTSAVDVTLTANKPVFTNSTIEIEHTGLFTQNDGANIDVSNGGFHQTSNTGTSRIGANIAVSGLIGDIINSETSWGIGFNNSIELHVDDAVVVMTSRGGDIVLGGAHKLSPVASSAITGTALRHITLEADDGTYTNGNSHDITINSNMGFGGTIGNVVVVNVNRLEVEGTVNAVSFTQQSADGDGTNSALSWFKEVQNYSGNFSFNGNALNIENAMSVTGTTTIVNTGIFAVLDTSGSYAADSAATAGTVTLGDKLTVSGVTINNGIITAGPITGGAAAEFQDNYYGSGTLVGNTSQNPSLVFKGVVTVFEHFIHNGDKLVFSREGDQSFKVLDPIADFTLDSPGGILQLVNDAGVLCTDTTSPSHIIQNTSDPVLEIAAGVLDPNKLWPTEPKKLWTMGSRTTETEVFFGQAGTLRFSGVPPNQGGDAKELIVRGDMLLRGGSSPAAAFKVESVMNTPASPSGGLPDYTQTAWISLIDGNTRIGPDSTLINSSTHSVLFNAKPWDITLNFRADNLGAVYLEAPVPVGGLAFTGSLAESVLSFRSDVHFQGSVAFGEGRTIDPVPSGYGYSTEGYLTIGGTQYFYNRTVIVNGSWINRRTDAKPGFRSMSQNADYDGDEAEREGRRSRVIFRGRETYIVGNSDWWIFEAVADENPLFSSNGGMMIFFSPFRNNMIGPFHKVEYLFRVLGPSGVPAVIPVNPDPSDTSGQSLDSASNRHEWITISKIWNWNSTKPEPWDYPPDNLHQDPDPPDMTKWNLWPSREKFWDFDLRNSARLDINRVRIFYSHSIRRIPVPGPNDPDGRIVQADSSQGLYYESKGYWEGYFDVNWIRMDSFYYSFTEDSNRNGRIDRIRIQAAYELMGKADAFSEFDIEVEDYEVDASRGFRGYERVETMPNRDGIYMYLKEKDYNDTGAILKWKVVKNDSLFETITGSTRIGRVNEIGETIDTVPPRINYALALPQRSQIFFQVSEPLVSIAGKDMFFSFTRLSDAFTTRLRLDQVRKVSDTEYLLYLDEPLGLEDLLTGNAGFAISDAADLAVRAYDVNNFYPDAPMYPSPAYPVNWDYTEYRSVLYEDRHQGIMIPQNRFFDDTGINPDHGQSHRATDMLISLPPAAANDSNYFIWPVWARDNETARPETSDFWSAQETDFGLVWEFSGRGILQHRDITIQARLNPVFSIQAAGNTYGNYNMEVYYTNPLDEFRSRDIHSSIGLWLPPFRPEWVYNETTNRYDTRTAYSNLVPWPHMSLYGAHDTGVAGGRPVDNNRILFNFGLNKELYKDREYLDFFFLFRDPAGSASPMYAGRLDIPRGAEVPIDWYRKIKPFTVEVHTTTIQRGGVTILNNVINPTRGEQVYVNYNMTRSGRVTIQVFTLDGNLVKSLRRENRAAGEYREAWDGTNRGGRPVARGMYFIRVVGPDIDEIRKVMVVK
ncbi:MAG: hypothetical protein LBE10_00840 [Treponema sp.]|jgi:hypothetical protein|nr:hypothetical protein [Treponema sp.]